MASTPFGFFPRRRLASPMSGAWPANPIPGGSEFEAFRDARAGEDVRWIDWISSRRWGEKLVRLAEEARAPGLLMVEGGCCGKASPLGSIALELAKLLSEEILYSDPESLIGLVAGLRSGLVREPLQAGPTWKDRILAKLKRVLQEEEEREGKLPKLLEAVRPWLAFASAVVFFLPICCLFLDQTFERFLPRLRAPGREVILFALAGRWELQLPSAQALWTFRDPSGFSLRAPLGSRRFRETFSSHASERLRELSSRLAFFGFRRGLEWEIVQEGDSARERIGRMAAFRRRVLG
ncbi:DUF58 domain-containing protein [Methylacidimicrobium tartarophylax]|uniref:DUF58 domain-containing protein n=1 Tax=Methylacidimicrobium tartarophylax TaxID=1041768 RepID=A0A5E6MCC0_9BACT|nr:DUF58 domain-containing protein [Methylacidimicrobium tartarophylax]VVM06570.1 hypothetical protein MAMT_01282 [Methylacidimicrobium tartarophylax]